MANIEVGDVVRLKDSDTDQLMTVLRFVGADDGSGLDRTDNQLIAKGFESGDPMCQWFEGTTLNTETFRAHKIEKAEVPTSVAPVAEETEAVSTDTEASEEGADEFDFEDEDFDF